MHNRKTIRKGPTPKLLPCDVQSLGAQKTYENKRNGRLNFSLCVLRSHLVLSTAPEVPHPGGFDREAPIPEALTQEAPTYEFPP